MNIGGLALNVFDIIAISDVSSSDLVIARNRILAIIIDQQATKELRFGLPYVQRAR
jgi:hypothetical protein